jgi:hypothetical protein
MDTVRVEVVEDPEFQIAYKQPELPIKMDVEPDYYISYN